MNIFKKTFTIVITLIISAFSFAKSGECKEWKDLKIEEDTGATMYNSGSWCAGHR